MCPLAGCRVPSHPPKRSRWPASPCSALPAHRHAEITYKLTLIATEKCKSLIDDFNQCAKGRSFTMVWACKAKYNESQDCIHK